MRENQKNRLLYFCCWAKDEGDCKVTAELAQRLRRAEGKTLTSAEKILRLILENQKIQD